MAWREKKDGKERGEGKREMKERKEEKEKKIEESKERADGSAKSKWTDAYRDLTLIDDNTQCNSLRTCFEPGHMVIVGETLTTEFCS